MLRRAILLMVAAVVMASGCASQTASTEFACTISEASNTALADLIPSSVTDKLAFEDQEMAPLCDRCGHRRVFNRGTDKMTRACCDPRRART